MNTVALKDSTQQQGVTTHNFRHFAGAWLSQELGLEEIVVASWLGHKLSRKKYPQLTTGRYVLAGGHLEILWKKISNAFGDWDFHRSILNHKRWATLWKAHCKTPKPFNQPFTAKEVAEAFSYPVTLDPAYMVL